MTVGPDLAPALCVINQQNDFKMALILSHSTPELFPFPSLFPKSRCAVKEGMFPPSPKAAAAAVVEVSMVPKGCYTWALIILL